MAKNIAMYRYTGVSLQAYMDIHTFRFDLQENELSSVITQTVPLECTHQKLSLKQLVRFFIHSSLIWSLSNTLHDKQYH